MEEEKKGPRLVYCQQQRRHTPLPAVRIPLKVPPGVEGPQLSVPPPASCIAIRKGFADLVQSWARAPMFAWLRAAPPW